MRCLEATCTSTKRPARWVLPALSTEHPHSGDCDQGCAHARTRTRTRTCTHTQEEFHSETVRKIQALHKYDCMRANKSTMAWGVEARVPFLDK